MQIPNAPLAFVAADKIADYLLNELHPVGGAKARWFLSLGYHASHPERLEADLLNVAQLGEKFDTQVSRFGIKYIVVGPIVTPSGKSVNVRTVWIVEPDDPRPRFVTVVPVEDSIR